MTHQRSAISDLRSDKCATATFASSPAPAPSRGFSLIEVLLAIFILGIGVISIAALFPAGIAQQRLSVDEVMGPVVADNALSILRAKLRPDDFGTFDEFGVKPPLPHNTSFPRLIGDWSWLRPTLILGDDPMWPPAPNPPWDETGAIDIFGAYAVAGSPVPTKTEYPNGYGTAPRKYGLPYNSARYSAPPPILIGATERYYPMVSRTYGASPTDAVRPQYVWDCMFRRFGGRIMVAIFVYRVTVPGGGAAPNYTVAADPSRPYPPLPVWIDLTDPAIQANSCANGPWDSGGRDNNVSTTEDNAIIRGVPGNTRFNADDPRHAWQSARQWILDQNMNLHRVLGVNRERLADDVEVELQRPAPQMPLLPMYYLNWSATQPSMTDVVSDIWYIPLSDFQGRTLTPVYVTVKEL